MSASLRLRALVWALRTFEKPYLARETNVARARRRLRFASRFFLAPRRQPWRETRLGALRALDIEPPADHTFSVLLWFHGGAFVQGAPETHRKLGQAMARHWGVRVILPQYRLAPEHPFPAAWEDALAAYRALVAELPVDRIILGGDSAGGGLAFALIEMIRAAGLAMPAGVIGMSPWADMTLESPSLLANAEADAMLPAARVAEIRDMVLDGADPHDPRASPVLGDFSGAPPALLIGGRSEILSGDVDRLKAAYKAAKVPVEVQTLPHGVHVLPIFYGWVPEARHMLDAAAGFVGFTRRYFWSRGAG
ncbi:MAG: alpha/beta hydrolase [Pseudomonadota bacterium]